MKLKYLTYLKESFGFTLGNETTFTMKNIPAFVSALSKTQFVKINGENVLFVIIEKKIPLSQIKTVFRALNTLCDNNVAIVSDKLDSRQRKALLQQKIPFVCPGKQAYLPFLGFVASTLSSEYINRKYFSPSTQAILATLFSNNYISTISQLASHTKMSKSSITRALNDLENKKIIGKKKDGKEIIFSLLQDITSTIKLAKEHCICPVSKETYILRTKDIDHLPFAGDSALADRSNLSYPSVEVRAISLQKFSASKFKECLLGQYSDEMTVKMQLWKYDPLIAEKSQIDKFSLALSFKDIDDERVSGELDSLFGVDGLW